MRFISLALLFIAVSGCQEPVQSQDAPQRVDAQSSLPVVEDEIHESRRTAITRAVATVTPAVVSINVIAVQEVRQRNVDPFFERFFGRQGDRVVQRRVQGLGSGFIVSPDGYIVTNDHVAGNATQITVAFPDGSTLDAELIGSDPETDIALIKVEPPEPLPFLGFTPSEPVVGEWAIALGNPFGLFEATEPTVTVGVISAVGRDFDRDGDGRVFRDMIQTDAAINQGNSGGPLVNAVGEVIGMNTFIFTRTGDFSGLSFAVPSGRIQRVIEELRVSGRVDRTFYTGLNVRPLNARIVQALNLEDARGLIVESVDPGSPAEQAGFRPYDVVVTIAGEQVESPDQANAVLIEYRAGDSVEVAFIRDSTPRALTLTLAPVQAGR